MNKNKKELIFVYNVKASLFAVAIDSVHKIISPDTYPCALCRITYGTVSMKKEWKNFVETIPYKVNFLHKDEFRKEYPRLKEVNLPAVFVKEVDTIKQLVGADEINKQTSIEDLKNLIKSKI